MVPEPASAPAAATIAPADPPRPKRCRPASPAMGETAEAMDAGEGYAPETANGDVVAQPVPTSAVRRGLEKTSLDYDENTEEGRKARAAAIARACGFDGRAVAKARCLREAFATIWA